MTRDEINYLIFRYYDNELDTAEEDRLFQILTQDKEARDCFKKFGLLKEAALSDITNTPASLDSRILHKPVQVQADKSRHVLPGKVFHFIAYAASISFLLLAIYFFEKNRTYEEKMVVMTNEIVNQKEKIELLFRSLPVIEVRATYHNANN